MDGVDQPVLQDRIGQVTQLSITLLIQRIFIEAINPLFQGSPRSKLAVIHCHHQIEGQHPAPALIRVGGVWPPTAAQ